MYFIDNHGITDPRRNLALEEACLRNLDLSDDFLLFYVNEPSIIIGRHQNTIEESNTAYVEENKVHVVRRVSGGGAVYHDFGNLNFSFLNRFDPTGVLNFRNFTEPVIRALNRIGVPAQLTGRNDIVADGRKISGNAQFSTSKGMVTHGTLLFDTDLACVVKALNVKMDKIESKGLKSVRSRVANISEFLGGPMALADFRALVLEEVFAGQGGVTALPLSEEVTAAAETLFAEKYSSWEWNFGASPPFNVQKVHRFDFGQVDARIEVVKGEVRSIRFFGDFLGSGDVSDIEKLLTGVAYRPESLHAAMEGADLTPYFGPVEAERFVSFLY